MANLEGKYFTKNTVVVKADGAIEVPFATGANTGKNMLLTPKLNDGQISKWTCAGTIEKRRLPSSCRE